jgi:hypothetical protein
LSTGAAVQLADLVMCSRPSRPGSSETNALNVVVSPPCPGTARRLGEWVGDRVDRYLAASAEVPSVAPM